jgi:hypothetical protein
MPPENPNRPDPIPDPDLKPWPGPTDPENPLPGPDPAPWPDPTDPENPLPGPKPWPDPTDPENPLPGPLPWPDPTNPEDPLPGPLPWPDPTDPKPEVPAPWDPTNRRPAPQLRCTSRSRRRPVPLEGSADRTLGQSRARLGCPARPR